MNVDVIYNMELKALKKYLMDNIDNPDIISLLNDKKIKSKILEADYQEFHIFLKNLPFKIISVLLENDGVDFLAKNDSTKSKIVPIINMYSDEPNLFKNELFCDIVIYNDFVDYGFFGNISVETAIPFLEYILMSHKSYLIRTLRTLETIQLEVIKRIEIPYAQLLEVINNGTRETIEYLLNNDERINSLLEFSFSDLYLIASKGVIFPIHLLYEDKFVNWVISIKDIKKYRLFVNAIAKNQDVSFIEEQRKKFYENEINSYDVSEDMLARYSDCYQELTSRSFDEEDEDELYKLLEDCLGDFDCCEHLKDLSFDIIECVLQYNYRKLKELFQEESHYQLTNMIIDYHFEDVAYNIFLDVKELLSFNSKVKVITAKDVLRYDKLINLDSLSYLEAKELFEELKNYHYSLFYDHMRSAKNVAIDLMEQVILNEETIQKYRDKDLSEQHGVDVYVLDGDDYYALVRAFKRKKELIIGNDDVSYDEDGSSYTLDCSIKRDTYQNPKIYYNLIYSSFPKNQIAHVFSVDSYSEYSRYHDVDTTERVYEIRTPEELVKASRHYNEIVIARPLSFLTDELNLSMQNPRILGIYCFDKINSEDIASAKNLGIGIVMVKTDKYKKYFEVLDNEMAENYEILFDSSSDSNIGFDYIRSLSSDDMAFRKRLHLNKN